HPGTARRPRAHAGDRADRVRAPRGSRARHARGLPEPRRQAARSRRAVRGAGRARRVASMLPAMRYTALLLDLDHTLLDSDASERLAFEHAMAGAGVADPGRHFPAYDAINRALWARVERGEIHATAVRVQRFAQLLAATGIDASPEALADAY